MNEISRNSSAQKPPKAAFLAATIVIFFLSLSAAESVGFVPCYIDDTCSSASVTLSELPQLGPLSILAQKEAPVPGVKPERIVIPEIDLDLPVQNIESRDIEVLYDNLKAGPIRYVDSALLGESGNVLIFGHSSRVAVVRNQMYKAFNRISELEAGDSIRVSGDGREYLYSVVSVERMDVEDPTSVISLAKEGRRLTLVTCDTLTGETARFVLTADFVAEI
ncbi:MAG: sortase [Candidatus Kaiserbacteria bacterium]|nr:MAG: sortase [Candidatus Kaiserbacteria bacterium]